MSKRLLALVRLPVDLDGWRAQRDSILRDKATLDPAP